VLQRQWMRYLVAVELVGQTSSLTSKAYARDRAGDSGCCKQCPDRVCYWWGAKAGSSGQPFIADLER
jgi:hypothetical protein